MPEELKPCPACGNVADVDYDDSFEQMRCPCGVSGPDFCDGEEKAIAVWNTLPRRLRWTLEKPTDGWYWLRRPGETPEVVNVDRGRYVSGKSYGAPLSNEEFDGAEWSGPIPEPEDAE